jgi:hypothetical protein
VTGVYARALGDAVSELHPKVQERYGTESGPGVVTVGRGEMDVSNGLLARPALYAMTTQNLLFPETGTDVPFTVTSVEYLTDAGHQVLGMRREFEFDGAVRRFDSRTLWDADGERLLDFLGSGGRLVSELLPRVEDGALVVEGGRQWLRAVGRYLPLPGPLGTNVTVRDYYDEEAERLHVHASLRSTLVGEIVTYDGQFTQERDTDRELPAALRADYDFEPLPPR